MKLAALLLAAVSASALAHDGRGLLNSDSRQEVARHMRLAKKNAPLDVQPITGRTRRAKNKRQCRERQNTATPPASSEQAQPTQDSGKKDDGKKDGDKANTGNVNVEWAPPADSGNNWDNGGNWGTNLIKVATDAVCGASGATPDISATAGPNGRIEWLNCGLNDGGWHPPFVTINDVVTVDLNEAIQKPDSPFKACQDFVWAFQQYGNENGIPPIMLASFAMQETTCNPNTVGGNGEQGLMQITQDKCGGAPGGNCKDVAYNVRTGAEYFKGVLDSNGGDLLQSIANYNGWRVGMTYGDATAAQWNGNCFAQNNLDYLHQFLNGWCQNIDAYTHQPPLGQYFNLNACY
ncbi:glycoside hydrolase family 23 protein [Schizophyllum commune]